MANRLDNVLTDLINSILPNAGSERTALLLPQCQLVIKKHQYQYSAIQIDTVYEQYDALIEKIGVLSLYGSKSTARIEEIVNTELNHKDYVTAQMLVLFKELAVHPERQKPRRAEPETLDELCQENGEDGEDLIADLLENALVINEDSEGSTLSDWSDDVDALAPTSPSLASSTSPRSASTHIQRAQREHHMGQAELKLFLEAVAGDEKQQPDLSGAAVDADVQRFRNFSYWNMGGAGSQPVVVAEATMVHELLVAIHGLPSIMFGVGGTVNRLRVLHLSVDTVQKLVLVANIELVKLQKVRKFLEIEKSFLGLQVFDDAIERLLIDADLRHLTTAIELELFSREEVNLDKQKKCGSLFSLDRVIRKLQSLMKDWHFVIQIIETIDEIISIDNNQYHCFIFVLQELYEALKIVFLTAENNPAFNRTLQLFKACFDYFSIEKLGPWFRRGQRRGVEFIEVDRDAEFGIKLNTLLLPKFLVKFKTSIFEIGLSRKLLQKVNRTKDKSEFIYDLNSDIDEDNKDELYNSVFTLRDSNIFWLEFDGNLEKWIQMVHASTMSSLIINPELDFFREEVLDWYFSGLLLPPSSSSANINYNLTHLLVLQDFRAELFAKLVRAEETIDKFQVFDTFKNCLKRNGVVEHFDVVEVSMKTNSNKYQTRLQVLEKLTLRVRHLSTEYVLTNLFLSAAAVAKYNEVWSELMKVYYILYLQTRRSNGFINIDSNNALLLYHQTLFYYKILEYYMFVMNEQYKRFRIACAAPNARSATTLFAVLNNHQEFLVAVTDLLFLNAEQKPVRKLLNEMYSYTLATAFAQTDDYKDSVEYFEDHFIAPFKTTLALFIYDANDDDNLLNFLHKRLD